MTTPAFQETRRPLPEAERPLEAAVLAATTQHFATQGGTLREIYDAMTNATPLFEGVTTEAVDQPDAKGWWVRPATTTHKDRAILFIHGGAYMLGSAAGYRGFASQIAGRSGLPVFVPDYPLAPEHRFPAAHDAILATRRWLDVQGFRQVTLVGDSAGGGLALASLAVSGSAAVASVVTFSPWVDLAMTGASFSSPDTYDPIFQPAILTGAAATYLDGADPTDGRASPLYAVPDTLPPLLIQVGADELLLDDSRRYADAAAVRGGVVRLDIFEGLHHVFQRSTADLPSARLALDETAAFISAHWR